MPPWWILCGNLILPMAIDYVYFYSIEFAKRIIRYRGMTMGTFDKMFDFNHDGELSPMEKGAKWGLINYLLNDEDE